MIYGETEHQVRMLSFLDVFHLLTFLVLFSVPLVLIMRKASE